MTQETADLDQLQADYKAAVEAWVTAIRHEEQLASGDHSIAEVDLWEQACFNETESRDKAREAKRRYEDALRQKFYHF